MKWSVLAVLLTVLSGAGCVNIGDKVALIAEFKTLPGVPGGTYQFRAEGQNKTLLSSALEQYQTENPPAVYASTVPVNITWEKPKPDKSFDGYETLSGLLTFLSLGIWPTIMTDEIHGTLRLANETIDRPIAVLIKKRYMVGWLSVLPVPAWAEWRGKESDCAEGEIRILKNAIAGNLRMTDYRKCLIDRIIRGKGVLLHEAGRSRDLVLRQYALQHEPEKWRHIQQIRAESAVAARNIFHFYEDLRNLGHDPWKKADFLQLCERWFHLQEQYREALIKLEKSFCTGEYRTIPGTGQSSQETSLETILQGTKK